MRILIIGGGSMGQAFAKGILSAQSEYVFEVIETNPANIAACENIGAKVYESIDELLKEKNVDDIDVCIVAVKPYDVESVGNEICNKFNTSTLILSIAAGIDLNALQAYFPDFSVVRAMPNIAASELLSATAICATAGVEENQLFSAISILKLLGVVVRVEESQMDLVTAISGSGPAYFFYLAEQLIAAAQERGMNVETAHQLVSQTFLGAATMAAQDGSFAVLREKVTSPGGTTQAALEVLEDNSIPEIFDSAISAAIDRSIELRDSDPSN